MRRYATALALVLSSCADVVVIEPDPDPDETIATSLELRNDLRELWAEHVFWTRVVIVGSVADLDDTGASVDRLLENQDALGDAIRPFYGDAAGDELTRLLREHITIALDVVYGASIGNADAAIAEWYANADEIARFLSDLNPAWGLEDTRQMMRIHLDQTIVEASARLDGDHALEVEASDEIVMHAQHLADTMANGIEAQFPERIREVALDREEIGVFLEQRALWLDQAMWTHLYIVSALAGLTDVVAVRDRLLRNAEELGASFVEHHGDASGVELRRLLREHVELTSEVVYGLAFGDGPETQRALGEWRANGDELASFLAHLNRRVTFDDLRAMIRAHLDRTLVVMTARINGEWKRDVATHDEIEDHILHLADVLSAGMVGPASEPRVE